MAILKRDFFERSTVLVARELLGKQLLRKFPDGSQGVMTITETEAYVGESDLASHARFGRTERNRVMYGHPGIWYVYLIYGIHEMLNVVTESQGVPGAVLIRAGIFDNGKIAKGPGVVTRELSIGRELYGVSALRNSPLVIRDGGMIVPKRMIIAGPRIGVDYAKEWKDKLWRFRVNPKLFKMNQ